MAACAQKVSLHALNTESACAQKASPHAARGEAACAQVIRQRSDTKMYRLQSPQSPLVRTGQYGRYCMDEFPSGTNMVVAVLSYTGREPAPFSSKDVRKS
jgi:hypothetical protein